LDPCLEASNFPQALRIRRSSDFRRIRQNGRKIFTPHFLLFVTPGSSHQSRLGLTVSRKIGGAVVRNKVKRRVREFFRTRRFLFLTVIDLSVIARAPFVELSQSQLEQEILAALGPYVRAGK